MSALLVNLSEASVDSEWCKNEINAGLLRELEKKQVLVMPVILEELKLLCSSERNCTQILERASMMVYEQS